MGANISEDKPVEQLFLDFSIQDVLTKPRGFRPVEPWASMYISAIREERFGDAIWARYHIYGDVENEIVPGSDNKTVLEVIKEDALEYKINDPEEYCKALKLYARSSSSDGHLGIIEMIRDLEEKDIVEMRAKIEAALEDEI
ncbi:hypothetical protein N7456_004690 [Penicillium angulare]|uniref:Uncharacterized protein n=1 Tax=Penicillium angulare TaxID=116970 RepID=A0A9W9KIU5_9EURO|nr:hypothetical protein N7456_004690 [Penicillium angulare]